MRRGQILKIAFAMAQPWLFVAVVCLLIWIVNHAPLRLLALGLISGFSVLFGVIAYFEQRCR